MKILIIQENSRKKESIHLRECNSLKYWFNVLGVEAECWGKGHDNFNTPFYEVVENYDIIFCLENYDNGWLPDLSKVKAYKIFWSIDSHCALKEHLDLAKNVEFDLHLNSALSYIKHYQPYSKNCMWFPNAIDHRYFQPKNIEKTTNIGFIGSMIADRGQICPILQKLVGLKSYENVIGTEYVDLINSFHIGFNKSISDDINYRIFETTACKVPLITNYVPGLEKLYKLDDEIIVYNSFKEMLGAITWLLNDAQTRNHVAIKGYKRTIENHTYMHRCRTLIEELIPETDFKNKIILEDTSLYERYNNEYARLKQNHEVYKKGWSSNFYSGHRSTNWALLNMIKSDKQSTLLDIGIYDGVFAKLASNYKKVYMIEQHPWPEMWSLVGLNKKNINISKPECEIVTMMNIAHNWPLENILEKVKEINGKLPEIIYLDSCLSNNHQNNKSYCDENLMNQFGFKLVYKMGRMIWKWEKR